MNNHQSATFHQIANFSSNTKQSWVKTPLALLGVDLKNFQFNKICYFSNHPYLPARGDTHCKGLNKHIIYT